LPSVARLVKGPPSPSASPVSALVRPIADAGAGVHLHAAKPNVLSNWLVWFVLFIWLNQTDRAVPLV
jgi:hypothetical protein